MSNLKFKLKTENEQVEERIESKETKKVVNLSMKSDESTESSDSQKKRGKKKTNKFFYKVSNHQELFRIGKSFYSDYLAGVKSFAITSTGYQTSQQKSILGLASFFDHKEDMRIGIISDNLFTGAFKDILKLTKKNSYNYFGADTPLLIHSFYNHFEFIDMNGILEICNNEEIDEYDEVLDHISELYDVIFWDVPELHKIQIDSEKYFPVIMKFESISIIVSQSLSKKADIDEIKRFFLGYGINLKGLLLEENKTISNSSEPTSQKTKVEEDVMVKKTKVPFWRKLFK
ncbi:MAG: hypothetical protein GY909_07005 [Oligoflexia bacterium]|nr:hypothetical protein [Oligoflexia bacterium]